MLVRSSFVLSIQLGLTNAAMSFAILQLMTMFLVSAQFGSRFLFKMLNLSLICYPAVSLLFFLSQIFNDLALVTLTAPVSSMVILAALNLRVSENHSICLSLENLQLLSFWYSVITNLNLKVTIQCQCLVCAHRSLLVFLSRPSPTFDYVIPIRRVFLMMFIKVF